MQKSPSKPGKTIQSIERAVAVLRCFKTNDRLGVTEISRSLGLHKSTVFGIIRTLEHCGLLEQDRHGLYRLGMELLLLGSGMILGLRELAVPHLRELVEQTGETVNLMTPSGKSVAYIEKIESPHSMRICTTVGQQFPFYCTAGGKAIFSFYSEEELDGLLGELSLLPLTQNTITDPDLLRREFRLVRELGYAEDNEEMEYGVVCVAVPIFDRRDHPVAAISVSGPAGRMTPASKLAARELLFQHASQISGVLG